MGRRIGAGGGRAGLLSVSAVATGGALLPRGVARESRQNGRSERGLPTRVIGGG